MKYPKKITFEGFYGFKNAGDDAFVEVASWGSRKYWHCENNVFLGRSLPETSNLINSSQILKNIKGFDRISLASHLMHSDYMVSAGGSTFGELPIHSNKALAKRFQILNKKLKLGAIGVSVGPFKSSKEEKVVTAYLKSLEFLALRDERSFEYTNSLNLPYKPIKAFDLAALLPEIFGNTAQNNSSTKKTIGISICNYESYTHGDLEKERKRNAYFKELIQILAKNTKVNFKVFIINGNAKTGDWYVSKELIANIDPTRVEIIPYLSNVKKTWQEISSCNLVISTRMHASIFACYAGIPFMLLEYHKKCTDFLNDVGQLEEYRLYDAEASLDKVNLIIANILSGSYQSPKYIKETVELSKRNFTHTIPLLKILVAFLFF